MADDDSNNALSCKVVLLGESGVGKTSIISRYTTNTFSSILMSTTGASFATKAMMLEEENQSVKFEIWDTAGQERYRALAKVFYKNASVCVLVYDITRKTSFDELKKYWINELKENASKNIILALAGNKTDMYEYEEVSEVEAKAFAKDIGAIFQTTSAKLSNGVEELFRMIGKKFVNPDAENLSNLTKDELEKKKNQIKIQEIKKKKNDNGGCCGSKKNK